MGSDTAQTTALLEGAVQSWYDEISDYTFGTGACAENKMCGHYTQVIWSATTTLGCGTALCGAASDAGTTLGGDATILVCNYAPPGNVGSQKPYVPGETCAACSASCSDGLCTDDPASCTDLDPQLTYNGVSYSTCAGLVAANAGVCSSWAQVGSTFCRLTDARRAWCLTVSDNRDCQDLLPIHPGWYAVACSSALHTLMVLHWDQVPG